MSRLSMYDVRDFDLMSKLAEEADDRGEISATELAEALGLGDDVKALGIRLAWMKRYGMTAYDDGRKTWKLAPGGHRVVAAKRKSAVADRVDAVPEEQLVDVMAHVTTRYRYGDPVIATLLRREFVYGTSARSSVWQRNGRRR